MNLDDTEAMTKKTMIHARAIKVRERRGYYYIEIGGTTVGEVLEPDPDPMFAAVRQAIRSCWDESPFKIRSTWIPVYYFSAKTAANAAAKVGRAALRAALAKGEELQDPAGLGA